MQECLQAEAYLEALKATYTRAGYNVETCVPNEGVLDSILELAKRHDLTARLRPCRPISRIGFVL